MTMETYRQACSLLTPQECHLKPRAMEPTIGEPGWLKDLVRGMLLAFHGQETGVLDILQWAGQSHKRKNYPEQSIVSNLV